MHVPRWVTLRLEEGVEVPEGALHISIRWHLLEAHLQEDLFELFAHLHQWMAVSAGSHRCFGIKVIFLKLLILPIACPQHLCRQHCLQFLPLSRKIRSLAHLVRFGDLQDNVLPLLEHVNLFLLVRVRVGIINELLKLLLVHVDWRLSDPLELTAILFNPLLFHGLSEPDLGNLRPDTTFHFGHVNFLSHIHFCDELELWGAGHCITLALLGQF